MAPERIHFTYYIAVFIETDRHKIEYQLIHSTFYNVIAYNNLATISMTHNLQIITNEINLLIRKTTMNEIQEYDLVALTEDEIATHKVTHQQILLRRGQMGTVLMSFDNKAFLIDFTDKKGNTFAMETIEPVKLLRLINEPELVYS